jgi:hypothetical protein
MTDKPKIKVIKKNTVSAPQQPEVAEPKSKRQAAREAVSTVKNWVSDFQARKRDETKAAIETLLATKTRPSEG